MLPTILEDAMGRFATPTLFITHVLSQRLNYQFSLEQATCFLLFSAVWNVHEICF
jgi:hypothetical protein